MVDRRLTADGGIHLCEQRSRQLHEVDTALEARGRVARDVADDAPAEGEEARVAMKARVDEAIDDCRERRERLVTFTVRQHERVDLAIPQPVLQACKYSGATTSFDTIRICFAGPPVQARVA